MARNNFNPRYVIIGLPVCSFVLFIITCVFNGLASTQAGVDAGLFDNTTARISDEHPTLMTPSDWTFSIWGVIYTWQAAWLIFIMYLLGTYRHDSQQIHQVATIASVSTYVCYNTANILNIIWLYFWSKEMFIPAFAVILITLGLVTACTCIVSNRLEICRSRITKYEMRMSRLLIQNGLGLYNAWLCIATIINFVIVLDDSSSLSSNITSTIGLSFLLMVIVCHFLTDIILLDKYTRFLFAPYVVFIFALAGIVDNHYGGDTEATVSVLIITITGFACLQFVCKTTLTTVRLLYRHDYPTYDYTPAPDQYHSHHSQNNDPYYYENVYTEPDTNSNDYRMVFVSE